VHRGESNHSWRMSVEVKVLGDVQTKRRALFELSPQQTLSLRWGLYHQIKRRAREGKNRDCSSSTTNGEKATKRETKNDRVSRGQVKLGKLKEKELFYFRESLPNALSKAIDR